MIIPAILAHSKAEFITQLKAVDFVAPWVHIDVLDGSRYATANFFDPETLLTPTKAHFELHLMVDHPLPFLEQFAGHPNVHRIYVDQDCLDDLNEVAASALFHGFSLGVALNPGKKLEVPHAVLQKMQAILLMGVNPGSQGQPVKTAVIQGVPALRAMLETQNLDLELSFDGGVRSDTISLLTAKGIDRIVVGSAIMSAQNPHEAFTSLSHTLKTAVHI